jgi:anti-anti-sigma factor
MRDDARQEDVYSVQWTARQAVVALPVHIDLANASQIRAELLALINRGATTLIADMTMTVSCDHAGAEAVIRAYQRAAASGTDLRLVVTSDIVRRVLSISGVDRLVPVYPTLEASLARTSPGREGELTGQASPAADVGVEVVLLDRHGVIVSVNAAWQAFAAANGGDAARVGLGVSYLEACDAAGGDPVAAAVGTAIRAALAGDLPGPKSLQVPCHGPRTARWFDLLVSPRADGDGRRLGATVTLSLVRSQPRQARGASQPAGTAAGPAEATLRLVKDHDRIDADSTDIADVTNVVVHRLLAAGLALQGALGLIADQRAARKVEDAISEVDLAIRDLRETALQHDRQS